MGLLIRVICALLIMLPLSSVSAEFVDAYELKKLNSVVSADEQIVLDKNHRSGTIKARQLQALTEAHRRIGDVSKISVKLVIKIDDAINAAASSPQKTIYFTTALLNFADADKNIIAGVMAHEYAHFYLNHSFESLLNLPNAIRRGIATSESVMSQTGNHRVASIAGGLSFQFANASFSRDQEAAADKVGIEFLSKAGYPPDSLSQFLTKTLQLKGKRGTGYFDTHPGDEERLASVEPVIKNELYASHAESLRKSKDWKRLGALVDQWIEADNQSAKAWFYKGILSLALKRNDELYSFANAVNLEPAFTEARLELCVALFHAGQRRDSLVCSEHLPINNEREDYVYRTFNGPIYVAMAPSRRISDEDALIIAIVLKRPDLVPSAYKPRDTLATRRERAIQRNAEIEEAYIANLRNNCESAKQLPISRNDRDKTAKIRCEAYDEAVRKQYARAASRR